MKKIALVSVVLGLALSNAFAGRRDDAPVEITPYLNGSMIVRGALGSAANSDNTVEYIGCALRTVGSATETYCFAKDAAGTQAQCRATTAQAAAAVASINADSYIMFIASSSSGTCTHIEVYTASIYRPKQS